MIKIITNAKFEITGKTREIVEEELKKLGKIGKFRPLVRTNTEDGFIISGVIEIEEMGG